MTSLEKWILTHLQKLPKNVGDMGKLIVAKGFKKLPKVQQITQYGHTVFNVLCRVKENDPFNFSFRCPRLWWWCWSVSSLTSRPGHSDELALRSNLEPKLQNFFGRHRAPHKLQLEFNLRFKALNVFDSEQAKHLEASSFRNWTNVWS